MELDTKGKRQRSRILAKEIAAQESLDDTHTDDSVLRVKQNFLQVIEKLVVIKRQKWLFQHLEHNWITLLLFTIICQSKLEQTGPADRSVKSLRFQMIIVRR